MLDPLPPEWQGCQVALTRQERAVIDFERGWFLEPGSKVEAIRARLDLSATSYYRLLATLTESAEAMKYDPLVIRRLQRNRERRRRARLGAGTPAADRPVR